MTRFETGFLAAVLAIGGAVVTIPQPASPLLVWNVSASAPQGLYWVRTGRVPKTGDMVIARLPERWRLWAAKRGYLPANVPLVKGVAAAAGMRICAIGGRVSVDGREIARQLRLDRRGRPLPSWRGCRVLEPGELFLLNAPPGSFDGRYFGVTNAEDVIGTATLLWRS